MRTRSSIVKHRNLPLLMLQAREHVIARFRPILNTSGMTEQQWRIVRLLLDSGPLEPRQISELCRISSPSLAGVLARMEGLGLLKRRGFKTDQRRLLVSLTPRSRALARSMAPQIDATYRSIEKTLGPALSALLTDTLDRVIESLARPPTSGDRAPWN